MVCQSDRYGFGLPLEVEPGRDRDVGAVPWQPGKIRAAVYCR